MNNTLAPTQPRSLAAGRGRAALAVACTEETLAEEACRRLSLRAFSNAATLALDIVQAEPRPPQMVVYALYEELCRLGRDEPEPFIYLESWNTTADRIGMLMSRNGFRWV